MPGGNLSGGRFLDTDSTGMSVRFSMPPATAATSISATARPYLRIFRSRSVEDEERGSSEEIIGAHPAEAAGSSAEREQIVQQNLADIPAVAAIAATEREAAVAARFAEVWPYSPREVGDREVHLQAPHFEERLGVELGHGHRSLPVEPDNRQILVDIKARACVPAFEVRAVGHDAVLP